MPFCENVKYQAIKKMSDGDGNVIYDRVSTLHPLERVGVNIISLAIAALIIRILVVWVETLKKWVEATADEDGIIAKKEMVCFECMVTSSWLVTGFYGFILVAILVWYFGVYNPGS